MKDVCVMKITWKAKLLIVFIILMVTGVSLAVAIENNQVTSVTVTPDPVKLGYSSTIKYTTTQSGMVSIYVYQENGEFVRNLLTNSSKAAGTYSQVWDGKNYQSVLVPDGKYKIIVELKDATGLIGLLEKLVTAACVPVVSSVSDGPKDPFNPAAAEQSTLQYTLSCDALVSVKVLKGTVVYNTLTLNEAKPAGPCTVTWNGRDSAGNLAPDAVYTYQIDAVNPLASTFKSTNKTSLVTVEKEPPQITGYKASSNQLKLGAGSAIISYTLSENASVTLKVYNSSGIPVRTILNSTAKNAGFNSSTWDGKKDLPGDLAEDGIYTVAISAVDNFGKPSVVQYVFITAAAQPVVTNVSVTPNPYNSKDGQAAISYVLSKVVYANVTVKILKGTTAVKIFTVPQQPAGNVLLSWDGKDSNGVLLGDAAYTVQVTAASTLIPTFYSALSGTFTIEATPPTITAFTLTPNPYKLGTGSMTIRFTLSEKAAVYINVYAGSPAGISPDSVPVRKLLTGQEKPAGVNSILWDGKNDDSGIVPDGTYTIKILAVDLGGNSVEAAGSIFGAVVPTIIGPVVSPALFSPADNITAAVDFTVSSDANVNVSILKGTAVVKSLATNMLVPQGTATHIEWDGTDNSNKLVADGPYFCQIDAVSPAELTFKTSYKGAITVEDDPPSLSGVLISPTIIKVGATATFRYVVSEAATVTIQVLDVQGTLVRSFPDEIRTAGGTYSRTWDTLDDYGYAVPGGNYTLQINAMDNYGNSATPVEMGFTVGDVPVISDVSVTPSEINTDVMEQAAISYNIPVSSRVNVNILDSLNKTYKNICLNREVTGVDAVYWNGFGTLGVCNPGTYTYKIEATSVVGAFKAVPVTGNITVTGTSGSKPKTCLDCHLNYPTAHPMTNCTGCHGLGAPLATCNLSGCHSTPQPHVLPNGLYKYHSSLINPTICSVCHNSNYPLVPGHPSDLGVLHNTEVSADCLQCHKASISTEHPRHLDDNGIPLNCNTCHQSSDPVVQQAIADNNKSCGACHTGTSNHEALHETTLIDANCTTVSGCHKQSLTEEHLNNPVTQTDQVTGLPKNWTCDTCHTSTKPNVLGAIATNNKHCAACHTQGHNFNLAEPIPADIPLYPGYLWTAPQDANLWAGETKVPTEFLIGGKVIISNRVAGVNGAQITDYYINEMFNQGWTETAITSYSGPAVCLQYAKDSRKAIIWAYGGSYLDDPIELPGGWRIEIVYQ
jgi:flagellar hook assembly protein FlgD